MKRKFKSGALAWGIAAALMAFPTNGVAADNNSAVCNLLATGNVYAADQCRQENTATNTQTATATGGNGGTATGGNAGPVQVVGDGVRGQLVRRQRVRERRRRRGVQQPRERAVQPDLRA